MKKYITFLILLPITLFSMEQNGEPSPLRSRKRAYSALSLLTYQSQLVRPEKLSTNKDLRRINSLPIFSKTESEKTDFLNRCAICLGLLTSDVRKLPCGHVFHYVCLNNWERVNTTETFTCPICRKEFPRTIPFFVSRAAPVSYSAANPHSAPAGLTCLLGFLCFCSFWC